MIKVEAAAKAKIEEKGEVEVGTEIEEPMKGKKVKKKNPERINPEANQGRDNKERIKELLSKMLKITKRVHHQEKIKYK